MINLYALKYFSDAARFKSMTKAAELNYLTRPAISLAIQRLEDEIGAKLLIHKKRSFELTQAGVALLKRAENFLSEAQLLKHEISSSKEAISGEFHIGSTRTLATFNMPSSLKQIKIDFPNVELKIFLGPSAALIEKLENKEIDLAYFITDESLSDYKSVVVSRGHYSLIKPRGLANDNLEFALTERRHETERVKVLYERQFGKALPVFSEVQSWDAIWNWVNRGLCGGLVPDFLFENISKTKSNHTEVIPKVFPYEIKALFAKNKVNHPIIKSFLENLKG